MATLPLVFALALGVGVFLLFAGLTGSERSAPVSRRPSMSWVAALLDRAGMAAVPPRTFLLLVTGCGAAAAVVTQLAVHWAVVSAAAGLGGALLPIWHVARRGAMRRRAVEESLVEAIEQVRDGLRSGRSVQEALAGLAHTGPAALRGECMLLARDLRLVGLERAMTAMRDRLSDPVFDVVASSLILSDRLGGGTVGRVLDQLARTARAHHSVRQEVRASQARAVATARTVAAIPVIVLLGVRLVNPGYLGMFDGPAGQLLLASCATSIAVGYRAMRWVGRVPDEPRVLA